MTETFIVAIDGPAGSGKSSVSKEVARRRSYGYLDTGAAYRALAWHVMNHDADTSDATAVLDAIGDFELRLGMDPDQRTVLVGDQDVTQAIREPRVSEAVSGVARVPAVRQFLNQTFHQLVSQSGREAVIIEGRDITTVVAPDAAVRLLLTADPEVRAARRSAELTGQNASDVAAAMNKRDAADSQVVDFMEAAEGVTVVDSTDLDFEQTIAAVLAEIDRATGETHA